MKKFKIGEFTPGVIQTLPDRRCEECGKVDECRPYGKGGKWICFECSEKDPKTTKRMMEEKLFGEHRA